VTGAKVRNNSLTGADARDNSLTGADVRSLTGDDVNDNSLGANDVQGLTGNDVEDNSLTGTDINESTLGKVPSAATADSAAAVTGVSFLPRVTANLGETKAVATKGPLTLQLRCVDNGGGSIGLFLEIDSSADNAAADANVSGSDDDDLDAADPPMEVASDSGVGQRFEQAGWSALTPAGERFEGYGWAVSNFGGANNCMAEVVLFG
jgi:hypothetical protein